MSESASFEKPVDPASCLESSRRSWVQDVGHESFLCFAVIPVKHRCAGRAVPGAGEQRVGDPRQIHRSRNHDADELGEGRKCRDIAVVERPRPRRGDAEHPDRLVATPKRHTDRRDNVKSMAEVELNTRVALGIITAERLARSEREP